MEKDLSIDELKNEIEDKKEELNRMLISTTNKEEILLCSISLDKLINKYYLKLGKTK